MDPVQVLNLVLAAGLLLVAIGLILELRSTQRELAHDEDRIWLWGYSDLEPEPPYFTDQRIVDRDE